MRQSMNAAMSAWVAICIDPIARSLGGALIYRMVKPFAVDSPDGLVVVRELRPIQAHPLDTPSELPRFGRPRALSKLANRQKAALI